MFEKIQAVLFDLDGTLINSTDTITSHFIETLSEMGLKNSITREQIASHLHLPYEEINLCLKINMDGPTFEKFWEIYRNKYLEDPVNQTYLYPGVPEGLKTLKDRGMKIGVATGKRIDVASKILEQLGAASCFDWIQGWEEGMSHKPAPDILLRAVSKLGVELSHCIMVGDADVDILASKNLGIKVLAATYGFGDIIYGQNIYIEVFIK